MNERIKEITVDDIIAGKVRKNDLAAYIYEQLEGVELYKNTHGTYYLERNGKDKVYVSYQTLRERLKGAYIRVSETKFEKVGE